MRTRLQYSPRKKKTKGMPECSVKKPATSSLSASVRSKGVRLVSASTLITNRMKRGQRGMMYQIACCSWTILVRLKLPASMTTGRTALLRMSSYETIWAEERSEPRKAYLLLADQPASSTP